MSYSAIYVINNLQRKLTITQTSKAIRSGSFDWKPVVIDSVSGRIHRHL